MCTLKIQNKNRNTIATGIAINSQVCLAYIVIMNTSSNE